MSYVEGMLGNIGNVDAEDGSKVLGHIFGDRRQSQEEDLSASQGISLSNANRILSSVAPILMGMLGSQTGKGSKKADGLGLDGIIGSFLGQDSNVSGAVSSFMDQDGDGSILDDLLGKIF